MYSNVHFDTKPRNNYQFLVGRHTILPSILEVPGIPGALNHSCSKARKGCQYVHIHQEFQVPKNGGIVSYKTILGVGFPYISLTYSLYRWVPPFLVPERFGDIWVHMESIYHYRCLYVGIFLRHNFYVCNIFFSVKIYGHSQPLKCIRKELHGKTNKWLNKWYWNAIGSFPGGCLP